MSFSFPKSKKSAYGYEPTEVDAFIAKAREQYARSEADLLASLDLRRTEFKLVKGGYSISAVDSAIDKLEDTFADREISRLRMRGGFEALHERKMEIKLALVGRLERKRGKRFKNTGLILRGYNRRQVERFLTRVEKHIESGDALSLDYVRRIIFKASRGGYAENQVDAFIDRVVELLQIERAS
ncbi:MAG: hypothetical protein RLZ71_811 [Actinomycetota bacterium]